MYIGCMYQEYSNVIMSASQKLPPQAVAGSGLSFMVGRLSYTFGLTGPCVSTDTACSSSLVATHLAAQVRRMSPPGQCLMGITPVADVSDPNYRNRIYLISIPGTGIYIIYTGVYVEQYGM
jgi:hypothetical protein